MLLTEYNEAEQMQLFKEDGTLFALVQEGLLTLKDAVAQAGVPEDAFQQRMNAR